LGAQLGERAQQHVQALAGLVLRRWSRAAASPGQPRAGERASSVTGLTRHAVGMSTASPPMCSTLAYAVK